MQPDSHRLAEIHSHAAAAYQEGLRDPAALVRREELAYLAAFGISPQVLFDYAEDFTRHGEPDAAAFVAVAELRRDYLRDVQKGASAGQPVPEPELPLRQDEWEGIAWLPRIAAKARCFLEGTLAREVMYGCSGDRAFLAKFHLTLPGFLEAVARSGNDREKLLRYVRGS